QHTTHRPEASPVASQTVRKSGKPAEGFAVPDYRPCELSACARKTREEQDRPCWDASQSRRGTGYSGNRRCVESENLAAIRSGESLRSRRSRRNSRNCNEKRSGSHPPE